ncbi:beta-glucosidase 11-like isoform X11 [Quercus robur]|uniref:beta-glucosidase 11-like isoform X11 n=1 Tax=Quercus robur TaxID=38942 RepID=UPI00216126AA|nr:beta-glucosidase 11-like isoform X11 [Quercus robur]
MLSKHCFEKKIKKRKEKKMLSLSHIFLFLLVNISVVEVLGVDKFSRDDFPPDFVFGSGTSAYQVEGAANEDGREPSIWDSFSHSGKMHGDNGDIACDQYHKYKDDVQLMVDTGLEAYRFSISWSRLIPNGRGPVNPKGLQYYNNLINELSSNGIQPHVTLHHSDFPQALEDKYGGWLSREMVKDFTAYADVCFRNFGDRVLHWSTMNEANVFVMAGYESGFLPPEHCSPPFGINCTRGNSSTEPYLATHHILLAHASAARLYKEKYQDQQHGFIGINLLAFWLLPLTNKTEDVIATRRAMDFQIGWYADPLVYGDYPDVMKKYLGSRLPAFTNFESNLVKGSFDFLGLNYYNMLYIKDDSSKLNMEVRDFDADMAIELTAIQNDISVNKFSIEPWGLQELLEYFKQAYGNPPIYIHENGYRALHNSSLEDEPRVNYLHGHIGALLDALRYADPLVYGDYPDVMKKNVGSRLPAFTNLESNLVKGSFDFLGLNYYATLYIKDDSSKLNMEVRDFDADMAIDFSAIQNDTSVNEFPTMPWALQELLEYFKQAYGNPPIYIHENGQKTQRNSSLEDEPRVNYLHGHIGALLDALRNGSNTRGYFQWAFLDVLELLDGYESSFGLYYVDLDDPDLKRQPKLSAHWYSHFLKTKGVSSDGFIKLEKNLTAFSHAHFSR